MDHTDAEQRQFRKMTQEPVPRLIVTLAIPTIFTMLITAVYNMADTFFVARLGTSAAGAVGIVFAIMAVIQSLGFMIGMGSGSLVSRALGERRREAADEFASTAFAMAVGAGMLLAATGLIFTEELMILLGATPTILPYAMDYAHCIFFGTPFMCCSFVLNNYLRAEGKAFFSMIGLTAGGVLNIILDPIFIFTFGFGTAGAAMATALSQLVSFVILLSFFLMGKSSVRIQITKVARDVRTYLNIIRVGLPTLMRQGLASIASIALNVGAAAFGDAAVAAMSISGRVTMFAFSAMLGFGQGFQPVSSFNYGAERYDRVRRATVFTAAVGTVIMLVLAIISVAAAPQIIAIFRKDDAEVMRIGVAALRAQAALLPLTGLVTATNMALQSIPLVLFLPQFIGLWGVVIAQPLSDLVTFFLAIFLFRYFLRMLDAKNKDKIEA